MVNRSNLVPTHTVDKNGRQTTVYRRNGAGASVPSVPAPELKLTINDDLVRETAQELLKDLFPGSSSRGTNDAAMRRGVVSAIRSYPEALVKELRDAIIGLDQSTDSENLRESLCELIEKKPSEAKLREAILLYPAVSKWNEEVGKEIIGSLREYEGIPAWSDLSRESDEVKARCVAMATVVSEVFSFSPSSEYFRTKGKSDLVLKDEALVDLVFEYPERAGEMAAVIRERKSVDPVLLRGIVASDSRALGEGSL